MGKEVKRVGQMSIDGSQAGLVYSTGGVSPTICAGCHGYAIGYIIAEDFVLHRCELLERDERGRFLSETETATGD